MSKAPGRPPPSTRSSLESKTRKIVPSATPAASAICLVVTVAAVLEQQRQGRLDQRLAAVVGGHRAGTGSHPAS